MNFLSERNLEMHREYLNDLMLKFRIFEKSYPEIVGKDIDGIYRTLSNREERKSAVSLLAEIEAHKLYFSSFTSEKIQSSRIKKQFGSTPQFIYELRVIAKTSKSGFLIVYEDSSGIKLYCGDKYDSIIAKGKSLLALDLCEHAYFYDYGFRREEYILNAISHFDFSKCEKSVN